MKKIIGYLIVVLVIIILAGVAGGYFWQQLNPAKQKQNIEKIACTMEAKLCPDGSYVSRTGPNCEFAECPAVKLSGITGTALLGPMCPVEKIPPDPKCADRPYKTDLVATSPDGTQIFQQFSSDTNGKFSVDLVPGEYAISSSNSGNIFSHCSSQGTIKVEKGKYTDITLHCDTGIR
jgi:hypothetical protein